MKYLVEVRVSIAVDTDKKIPRDKLIEIGKAIIEGGSESIVSSEGYKATKLKNTRVIKAKLVIL